MTRAQESLLGAVLALLGVAGAFGVLEAGVRILHLVPDRFWEPDPQRGARLVANREGWWSQEEREFLIPVRINSLGMNDIERTAEKRKDTTRVLLLGDSFAEALHVPLESGFARVLERRLNEQKSGSFEVLNAGVSGYGTASEVMFYEGEGERLDPDAVLLAFYPGNDIRNNSPVLEDAFRPVYDEQGNLQRVEAIRASAPPPRLAALRLFRQLASRQPTIANLMIGLGWLEPTTGRVHAEIEGVPVGYGMYRNPVSADWQDAWTRTEALLDRLRQRVESRGRKFAVVLVTARERIYPDTWSEVKAAHPAMAALEWDLDAPEKWMRGWCEDRKVACLTLTEAFEERATAASTLLHYRHDGHWTEDGHKLAAERTAEFVGQLHWAKSPQTGVQP